MSSAARWPDDLVELTRPAPACSAGSALIRTRARSSASITEPRSMVCRATSTSWVLVVAVHAHAASRAPRQIATTAAATSAGRRRSFGGGTSGVGGGTRLLVERPVVSGGCLRSYSSPLPCAARYCTSTCASPTAICDRPAQAVQPDGPGLSCPCPGDDPVRGRRDGVLPARLGASSTSCRRGRSRATSCLPYAASYGVPAVRAHDLGAVTHVPGDLVDPSRGGDRDPARARRGGRSGRGVARRGSLPTSTPASRRGRRCPSPGSGAMPMSMARRFI